MGFKFGSGPKKLGGWRDRGWGQGESGQGGRKGHGRGGVGKWWCGGWKGKAKEKGYRVRTWRKKEGKEEDLLSKEIHL